MTSISSSLHLNTIFTTLNHQKDSTFTSISIKKPNFTNNPFHSSKNPSFPHKYPQIPPPKKSILTPKCAEFEPGEAGSASAVEDEWLSRLPDKKKPLYAHSLPCIEAWLKSLGFYQSRDDRAVWFVDKPDWHAQLSLDVTDLYIRYLKNGPGNLEKDMERRFSYALSREDIENAVLGGP